MPCKSKHVHKKWRAKEGRHLQLKYPANHDSEASKKQNNPEEEEATDRFDNGEEEETLASSTRVNPDISPPRSDRDTLVSYVLCIGI